MLLFRCCLQTPWGYYPCSGFQSHHTALLPCMNVLLEWLINSTYWGKEKGNETSLYGLQVLTDLEEVGSVPAWKWAICTHRNHLPLSRCNLDPMGTMQRKAVDLDVLGNCIEALPGEYPTPKTKCHTREDNFWLFCCLRRGLVYIFEKKKKNLCSLISSCSVYLQF